MAIPLLPLILLGGGLLLLNALGRGGRGGQRPPQGQIIRLPQRPLTREEVLSSLFFTRGLAEQLLGGGSGSMQAQMDIGEERARGLLREAQRLTEESMAIRGFSGGMGGRLLADALLQNLPQAASLQQASQAMGMQQLMLPLQELTTLASLTGQIGAYPVLPMLQFMGGLQANLAAHTGMWNPTFQFGMFPETRAANWNMGFQIGQLAAQLLPWILMFLRGGGGGAGGAGLASLLML